MTGNSEDPQAADLRRHLFGRLVLLDGVEALGVPQLDAAALTDHVDVALDAGVRTVVDWHHEPPLPVELELGGLTLEDPSDVVVRLAGLDLLDELVHHALE